jgi:hypothetical protein
MLELSAAGGIRCAVVDMPFNVSVLWRRSFGKHFDLGGASVADQIVNSSFKLASFHGKGLPVFNVSLSQSLA